MYYYFFHDTPFRITFHLVKLYLQILSELDIYARVGSNTPLVLMDALEHVIDGGTLTVRFEEVIGSPILCAICIRKAPSSGIPFFLQLFQLSM